MSIPTAAREAPTVRMRVPSPAAQAKRDKPSRIPDSRIGLLRPVHVMQVALWEIAVIAVVATVYPWRTLSIVVACVAAVVIALTSFRRSGLCAYQWIGVHVHFRRRTRTLSGPDPIGMLLPGLSFRRQIDRAGNRAGLVALDDSLTAVVRLVPITSPAPDALVDVLTATFERADLRLAGAQLVVWSVPSPRGPATTATSVTRSRSRCTGSPCATARMKHRRPRSPGAAVPRVPSYSLRRTARGQLFAESNVRVGLHPTAKPLDAGQIGRALGVRLVPCDGRHGRTVLANLPLAR
jgi:hypothetical protein